MPRHVTKRETGVEQEGQELEVRKFILEKQKVRLAEDQSWFEFHKHMTTLNTGVIIIVATLVEKVFTNIDAQNLKIVAVSFYAFLASITLSAIGLGYHLPSLRTGRSAAITHGTVITFHVLRYVREFLLIASLLGFLLGILFFILFALGNNR